MASESTPLPCCTTRVVAAGPDRSGVPDVPNEVAAPAFGDGSRLLASELWVHRRRRRFARNGLAESPRHCPGCSLCRRDRAGTFSASRGPLGKRVQRDSWTWPLTPGGYCQRNRRCVHECACDALLESRSLREVEGRASPLHSVRVVTVIIGAGGKDRPRCPTDAKGRGYSVAVGHQQLHLAHSHIEVRIKKEGTMEFLTSARLNRVRSIFVSVGTVLMSLIVITSIASATPPTREESSLPVGVPFIFQDTKGNDPCGFPVEVLITANNEVITTFTRQNGVTSINTTGVLKVQLTNTVTGESIDRNISGPILGTLNADGSITQIGPGPSLWVFDPGVAPDLPRLAVVTGRTVSVLGPGTAFSFISWRGTYEDLCATLGP